MEVTLIPIVIGVLGIILKVFIKGLEDLEIREQVGGHQECNILKIGQNIELL